MGGAAALPAEPLRLEAGDHICLLGNTLAERMQHHGWLETLLYARFPRHELVIRNLGFSGDELTTRLRSEAFGSPDEHLTFNKADVIFAFFGFNESFRGEEGLEQFKTDLDKLIRDTLAKKYNGKTAPRLVFFSPIAHEDLGDPNLPDGSRNNKDIRLYAKAMAAVARAAGARFVDLFTPTLELYGSTTEPLTINGIHLNERGDRALASIIDRALFGPEPRQAPAGIEKLHGAVLDKCFYWFQRHRVVDGYSVYGGRSHLKFVDGQTNREVMQRELEVLDVMTANRDRIIWAAAQGKDLAADDSNTPPFIPVKTNKPGPGPDGAHAFLDGEEAIGKMKIAKGMKVNLFATEKEFPVLANPVQMTFDARGRLWVSVMPSYPHWKPKDPMEDKVLIFEDSDGDGKADVCKVFADKLHVPTGIEHYGGGLLVGQAPVLLFLQDTDGDDRADRLERMLHGIDSADTHHAMNSFVLDPGGALYFQEGVFHHTQVETLWGPERCANAGVFRYEPRTHRFDVYVSYGFANPHGHVFDRWGQDFVTDGTGSVNYFAAAFSGRVQYPRKHPGMRPIFNQRTRPCPGTEILSSRHFPDELQDNYLVANVIGMQGILQYRIEDDGSGLAGKEVEPIVESTDPNFRPSDLEVGPDGAIYFLDWHNPIIGHMQHNLRDPSRGKTHGRIYRVTYPGRPLLTPVKIAGEPVEKLLEILKEPENRVRYRAKIELSARPSAMVIAALGRWIEGLDKTQKDHEHHLLEALWTHQHHNTVNEELLRRVLSSPEPRARAAATRVLCYWRDRVPDAVEILKRLALDEHPRVRLEAVRAASFFTVPYAAEVAILSAERPSDYYLDYTRGETMRTLEPYWKKALAEGRLPVKSRAVASFLLESVSPADLLKSAPGREVCLEVLLREGMREEHRSQALKALARIEEKDEVRVLLDVMQRLDGGAQGASKGQEWQEDAKSLFELARLLAARAPSELAAARGEIERLATAARLPVVRQVGLVALITADGAPDGAWELCSGSAERLLDLVSGVPLLPDATLRASLYPKVEPLLRGLPAGIPRAPQAPGAEGEGGTESAVRRAAMSALTSVRGKEANTFRALARLVHEGAERAAAIRALRRIPASFWPAEEARPLAQDIVRFIRGLAPADRTSSEALDALQLGDAIASRLTQDEAKRLRAELGELGVRVVRLGTVPHQMLYDQERITIAAGKPVEIVFENTDLMPHNFVVTRPGSLEEIGESAERMATRPGALERHYVPESKKVIVSSRLLQPQESQKIAFTAPTKAGVYPYVCTYPGHWRRMFGALYVVESLEEFLAGEEAYLAAHPLPIADKLLELRRPRKEWTLDDLASSLDELDHGRSFGNARQIFQVASCAACHRVDGVGNELGPDLTKLDPKLTRADILREMLEPSAKLNEKFFAQTFVTGAGKVITGLVLGETPEVVRVIENPLAKAEPVELKASEIVQREKSTISLMPKGLLDTLTREEILDLLAYLEARGDRNHKVFQGGCGLHSGGDGGEKPRAKP